MVVSSGEATVTEDRPDWAYIITKIFAVLAALPGAGVAMLMFFRSPSDVWGKFAELLTMIATLSLGICFIAYYTNKPKSLLTDAISSLSLAVTHIGFLVRLYPYAMGNNDSGEAFPPTIVAIALFLVQAYMALVRFQS